MKQVLQDLSGGQTLLVDVPVPATRPGTLTIATRRSLVSLGTERMLTSFGRANWVQKALREPERALQVIAKIKTDGLLPTLDAVKSKLSQPIAMGYCNAGVVLEVGAGVTGYQPGDRVLSNGPHAEVVNVPVNLCAQVPGNVGDDSAPFAVIGAIALQGIRLLEPTLGERVVVTGLGLVGLLAVQLLQANGVRVLGADPEPSRCKAAERLGATTVVIGSEGALEQAALAFTAGAGLDGALITASTSSSEPINQAARACRKRGRIVQVGATGLELQRAEFYQKELTLQVSCSYGPGRYDTDYEQRGNDYPAAYVRWTEQRNFQAVLEQMALGRVQTQDLVTHRFGIDRAHEAYDLVAGSAQGAILLEYDAPLESFSRGNVQTRGARSVAGPGAPAQAPPEHDIVLGVLGAGNYASRTLLPALAHVDTPIRKRAVVSKSGVSSKLVADRFGFELASSDAADVLDDPDTNVVLIASRDALHAPQALHALGAGKHVFVEKPMCLTVEQCDALETAVAASGRLFTVGYNRRFAPLVVRMKALLDGVPGPRAFVYLVNAGAIGPEHWTQDPSESAGRLIGEACHFIDLLRHLARAPIVSARCDMLGPDAHRQSDVATLSLTFEDGSIGSVHYLANGSRSFPKERLTVFAGGRVLELDNFKTLRCHGFAGFSTKRALRQDKGHAAELAAWFAAIQRGGPPPIEPRELFEVSRVSIALSTAGTWPCP
jgi:predicted dehydrogenase/threonine dehydrogenase-like Zn-dependent dehydrogenase